MFETTNQYLFKHKTVCLATMKASQHPMIRTPSVPFVDPYYVFPANVNLGYGSKVRPESICGQMNLILELEGIQFVVKPFVIN